MLTVLSWNILADSYIRPELFPYTPPVLLEPPVRGPAILARLLTHATNDVLCLQEIEPAMFAAASARLDGFEGRFLEKRGKPDGCAIFVRRAHGVIAFHELVYTDGTGHGAVAAVVDGVGIATTHLKWQPSDVEPEKRLGRAALTFDLSRCSSLL